MQLLVIINNALVDGGCSSVGRAPDRGSGGRGFEPLYPPHFVCGSLAQLVEQGTLNPKVEGSTPSRPTIFLPTIGMCFSSSLLHRKCLKKKIDTKVSAEKLNVLPLENVYELRTIISKAHK